jgi:hypothetical protein
MTPEPRGGPGGGVQLVSRPKAKPISPGIVIGPARETWRWVTVRRHGGAWLVPVSRSDRHQSRGAGSLPRWGWQAMPLPGPRTAPRGRPPSSADPRFRASGCSRPRHAARIRQDESMTVPTDPAAGTFPTQWSAGQAPGRAQCRGSAGDRRRYWRVSHSTGGRRAPRRCGGARRVR